MGFELDVSKESLFIKKGKVLHQVKVRDVMFLSSDGNYVILNTEKNKFVIKISLKRIMEHFPKHLFIQIHRSYVVQISCIEKIDLSTNELVVGDHTLGIGRKYKSILLDQLNLI